MQCLPICDQLAVWKEGAVHVSVVGHVPRGLQHVGTFCRQPCRFIKQAIWSTLNFIPLTSFVALSLLFFPNFSQPMLAESILFSQATSLPS